MILLKKRPNHHRLRTEATRLVGAVRQGLVMAIPFLLLGSFALVFTSLPSAGYQDWIHRFAGGLPYHVLTVLYQSTLHSLALILTVTISAAYGSTFGGIDRVFYVLVALGAFLAFTGFPIATSDNILGPEWAFTSIIVTLLSCSLFRLLLRLAEHLRGLHTVGIDYVFNLSIQALFPAVLTLLPFAVVGRVLKALMGDFSILNFGSFLFLRLFDQLGNSLFSMLLYVFLSHTLWFFGIHGTNTLEAVSTRLFEQGITVNEALLAAGQAPTEIYTKTFLDVFVFMGGCGTALCFILAMFLAAREHHNRRLAGLSALPVVFNISEIAVFGFPIILNPLMIVPFVLTPLVLVLTSSAAMYLGLVPPAVHSVAWTVPVFFSGYEATGSLAGCVLQLVNTVIGVSIYIPFIRLSERRQSKNVQANIRRLEEDMRQGEAVGRIPSFLRDSYPHCLTAKTLCMDLSHAMHTSGLALWYQPQIRADGSVYGVEALLRWHHGVGGLVYPPLVVILAEQEGVLDELGLWVIEQALRDREALEKEALKPEHLSVNVSPHQLESPAFVGRVGELLRRHPPSTINLVFELTEQIALSSTPVIDERLEALREMGIQISMDDFGMGHSSIMYLNNSMFDEVKLDGSLVRQMTANARSREIISSITALSETLRFEVVAEYVETQEQADMLAGLGCTIYQGYLYGKALPLAELIGYLDERHREQKRADK